MHVSEAINLAGGKRWKIQTLRAKEAKRGERCMHACVRDMSSLPISTYSACEKQEKSRRRIKPGGFGKGDDDAVGTGRW